ncbi:MAG: hypothetical protein ABI895_25330 [Deltaproteobacteria bacterium]
MRFVCSVSIVIFTLALAGCSDEDGDDTSSSSNANQPRGLSFFVTSVGSGADGGNLGGLAGADARCQQLAQAAGAGSKTWHAYLSTSAQNARDRIGTGPWFNQAGDQVADSVADLHEMGAGLSNGNPQHVLDENGMPAPGNQHDVLTGSLADGTLAANLTCMDWTSNSATLTEQPQVGHSDIPANPMFSPSWNAAHVSADCSEPGLTMRGGAGRLYCFATN